ncbi:MAG: helicase-related protein [Pseudomonadota bacterium]
MRDRNFPGAGVTAILGPTNTGKTHYALERMVAHPNGVIGLPLRLLAREVYGRLCDRVGERHVALVTGEEKISPPDARYTVCTVEAMPRVTRASFVAIDEVQLAGDIERGHVFTDRILHLRGAHETLLLGAGTMAGVLRTLLPGITITSRERMSMLTYAGSKKISRLPRRSAIVAFSADEVYAIAELVRRQRGGAAVVLGALSPRTRNKQVELYQNGDVDYLIATDAIGMGLNLDVDHVAFAQNQKFDGVMHRPLTPVEAAQIAGRAGRHTRDGTFGVTSRVLPFSDELVEQLETHQFAPLKRLNWRSRELDLSDPQALMATLDRPPTDQPNAEGLTKSQMATDHRALESLMRETEIRDATASRAHTELLWEVCQVPDYRRIAPADHAYLLGQLYLHLANKGRIAEDWFAAQVQRSDRTDGEIDTLSSRVAHVRTWTFLANKTGWLENGEYWKERTRQIENALSDALHERLTKRFVDRRTSVLMKRLRENAMLEAEIADSGDVVVEGHHVGQLIGFRFTPDRTGEGPDAKAISAAAAKALANEIDRRATRLVAAAQTDFALAEDGTIRWVGAPVGRLVSGDEVLSPRVLVLADEHLSGPPRDVVEARLTRFAKEHIETTLKPLFDLQAAEGLDGMARGVAYRIVEDMGVVERREIATDVRNLDQDARALLRKNGVRFGAHHIFVPGLLKPGPSSLICLLWALKAGDTSIAGLSEIPQLSASGRTSVVVDATYDERVYRLAGFRVLGSRAVRVDILERLADLIRPALSFRPGDQNRPQADTKPVVQSEAKTETETTETTETKATSQPTDSGDASVVEAEVVAPVEASAPTPANAPSPKTPPVPEGAFDGRGFVVTPAMLSILGATRDDMDAVLKALGYRADVKPAAQANEVLWSLFPKMKLEAEERAAIVAAKAEAEPSVDAAIAGEPEEETVTIWRPQRNDRGGGRGDNRNKGTRPDGFKGKGGGRNDGNRGQQNRGQQHRGKPNGQGGGQNAGGKPNSRPAKQMDPDSPFAKLAALKGDLGKKG